MSTDSASVSKMSSTGPFGTNAYSPVTASTAPLSPSGMSASTSVVNAFLAMLHLQLFVELLNVLGTQVVTYCVDDDVLYFRIFIQSCHQTIEPVIGTSLIQFDVTCCCLGCDLYTCDKWCASPIVNVPIVTVQCP